MATQDVWANFKKLKVVGRGAFGSAYLAKNKKTAQQVVIKELFANMTEDEKTTSVGEIQVLSILRHPNIIAYYDSFLHKEAKSPNGTLMIVMEFADGGTLEDYIKRQTRPLSEMEILIMYCQTLLGLSHVHSQNILHRDLKVVCS